MMTCEASRKAFTPHLDGRLSREAEAALDLHLGECPVCRADLEAERALVRRLRLLERPAPPAALAAAINSALAIERAAIGQQPKLTLIEHLAGWLRPRLMPYAAGAFYSLLLFVAVFGALRQQMQALHDLAEAQKLEEGLPYNVAWVEGQGGFDVRRSLSPELAAAARAPFAAESPTLNPRGALAAMAWTPPPAGGSPDDDDMIVVADVYGNGSASLAAVVEPPRNRRALEEFQDALRKNPAFVPASLDRRPQTMRVVFVLQRMNVPEESF